MVYKDKEKISKLVFTANSIETSRGWSLADRENPLLCEYCKSPLFYIEILWGIIDETDFYKNFKFVRKERVPQCGLREVGFNLYCAECGNFHEHYSKYFYPEDKLVCYWKDDELNMAEYEEIEHCLKQYNQKGKFIPNYNSPEMRYLKNKLEEYEKISPSSQKKDKKNKK